MNSSCAARTMRSSFSATRAARRPAGLTAFVMRCSITAIFQCNCNNISRVPMTVPQLDGTHQVKRPVRDLARSRAWYESRLGYRAAIEFIEQGTLMGIAMRHPNGGPEFALRLDPARAEAAAGFDYFAIGVPSKEAIEDLAARLTSLADPHAGGPLSAIARVSTHLRPPPAPQGRLYA